MSRTDVILLALGWVLVMEGLPALIAPERWREALRSVSAAPSETLRAIGAGLVLLGISLVWLLVD